MRFEIHNQQTKGQAKSFLFYKEKSSKMYGRKGGTGGGAGTTDWTSIWETPIQGTVRQVGIKSLNITLK